MLTASAIPALRHIRQVSSFDNVPQIVLTPFNNECPPAAEDLQYQRSTYRQAPFHCVFDHPRSGRGFYLHVLGSKAPAFHIRIHAWLTQALSCVSGIAVISPTIAYSFHTAGTSVPAVSQLNNHVICLPLCRDHPAPSSGIAPALEPGSYDTEGTDSPLSCYHFAPPFPYATLRLFVLTKESLHFALVSSVGQRIPRLRRSP